MQLQQNIALTQRNVKSAYYDLMYAVGNLNVQRQSLELAQQSLKDNRARVEIGTMAPIDIVQAEAEVAQREESLILAEAAIIARRGSPARAGVQPQLSRTSGSCGSNRPSRSCSARRRSTPKPPVTDALQKRTDLLASRKQLDSNDVNIRYFKNQTMPDVNASLTYFAQAIGGTAFLARPRASPARSSARRRRATAARWGRCSPATSRRGRCRCR